MIKVYNAGDKTFGIRVGSTLTREDYKEIVPEIEQKIKQFGSIKLLMQIDGFKSIEPAALWEELKFDIKHRNDFEQIAIVGDENWGKWSAKFGEIFFDAHIKYFQPDQVTEAWEWLGVSNKVRQV